MRLASLTDGGADDVGEMEQEDFSFRLLPPSLLLDSESFLWTAAEGELSCTCPT